MNNKITTHINEKLARGRRGGGGSSGGSIERRSSGNGPRAIKYTSGQRRRHQRSLERPFHPGFGIGPANQKKYLAALAVTKAAQTISQGIKQGREDSATMNNLYKRLNVILEDTSVVEDILLENRINTVLYENFKSDYVDSLTPEERYQVALEEGFLTNLAVAGGKKLIRRGANVIGRTPIGTAMKKTVDAGRAVKHHSAKFAAAVKSSAEKPTGAKDAFKAGQQRRTISKLRTVRSRQQSQERSARKIARVGARTTTPTASTTSAPQSNSVSKETRDRNRLSKGQLGVTKVNPELRARLAARKEADAAANTPDTKEGAAKSPLTKPTETKNKGKGKDDPSKKHFGAGIGHFGAGIPRESSTVYARIGALLSEKVASNSDTKAPLTIQNAMRRRFSQAGLGNQSKRKQDQVTGMSMPQGGNR